MHLRPDHAVRDIPTLHSFIEQNPLGVLTTSLPSADHPTLQCSHIPWVLDRATSPGSNPASQSKQVNNGPPNHSKGVLRGHIARQNPQSKAMVECALNNSFKTGSIPGAFPTSSTEKETESSTLPGEVLIVFTSPVDHYITPNFYTESKPATGKVAPTWNYAAVQVYGRATIYHDSKDQRTELFLRQQLNDLAKLGEERIMGFQDEAGSGSVYETHDGEAQDHLCRDETRKNRSLDLQLQPGESAMVTGARASGTASSASAPWVIADAPSGYIAALLKNIVGISVEITRVEGRFKVSQERPVGDRGGVVEGLERMGGRAKDMAEFVRSGRVLRGD
ncbi:FMN-binding split barrel-related protein [Penicillium bovifimosum]|uniref:FMN-binding split barrel-related protein n=1 Tax=Penicillium bovifimosum TaxID=126998 RepID=A0A9W9HCG8_9EURO|nr:FMN-binding split barrel-related protein [Penicillium bovifimosum]KAJ5144039.1 FMN-binding split barrel-related protein [Penicillium bovifimosum]